MSDPEITLEQVKGSQFGCSSCLWCSCECSKGSMFKPATMQGKPACSNYTYYD